MKGRGLLILCFCILFSGCATVNKGADLPPGEVKPLFPQDALKFSDIPLPSGFKFLHKDSYSFQTENVRVAVLKYSGRPDVERVFKFFKEQLPLYNWHLINTTEFGRRMLNFDRDQETCIITVESRGLRTEFVISIGPKQGSAKKLEKPIK